MDETEPPVEDDALDELEPELAAVSFPATGHEVVAAVGDRELETPAGPRQVAELVPDSDEERFEEPAAVRALVARPTVAAAMKRVVEAAETLPNHEPARSQRDAHERTFRALASVDATHEDAPVGIIADWIVERIHDKEKLPGSRDVRRQAAKHCRSEGYAVRNDEWLGV